VKPIATAEDAGPGEAAPGAWVGSGVVLRLGAARYAVPMAQVAEVVHVPACTRVPAAPGWLVGVANWRGRVLPVLDLRPLLGAEPVPLATSARLVILAVDDVEAGVLADQVPGPLPQAEWAVAPPPPTAASAAVELITGVLHDDGGPVSLLDARAVLALGSELAGR
jgi:chemotaxis signal transduction protein